MYPLYFSFVYPTEITSFSDSCQEFEKMSKRFQGLQIQKYFYCVLTEGVALRRLFVLDKQRII